MESTRNLLNPDPNSLSAFVDELGLFNIILVILAGLLLALLAKEK